MCNEAIRVNPMRKPAQIDKVRCRYDVSSLHSSCESRRMPGGWELWCSYSLNVWQPGGRKKPQRARQANGQNDQTIRPGRFSSGLELLLGWRAHSCLRQVRVCDGGRSHSLIGRDRDMAGLAPPIRRCAWASVLPASAPFVLTGLLPGPGHG